VNGSIGGAILRRLPGWLRVRRRVPPAAQTASIVVLGGLLLLATAGHFVGVPRGEAVPLALVVGGVVFAALLIGGRRRGLLGLWGSMAAFWLLHLVEPLERMPPIESGVRMLPDGFVPWSLLALPLAAATVFSVGRSGAGRTRGAPGVLAAWLVILVPCSYLAGFAPEVGSNPRDLPAVLWLCGILLPPAPFLLCGWMMTRVHRSARADPLGAYLQSRPG